jgi:hypothetical protein
MSQICALFRRFHSDSSSSDNLPLEGVEIAYRMKFSQSAIEGRDARVGHGQGYTIQLMILDFDST